MTIEIPADLEPFVREQLKLGYFHSESQVVAEGLRMLKAEREECVEGIRRGLADAAAGRMQPLGEALEELRKELKLVR